MISLARDVLIIRHPVSSRKVGSSYLAGVVSMHVCVMSRKVPPLKAIHRP